MYKNIFTLTWELGCWDYVVHESKDDFDQCVQHPFQQYTGYCAKNIAFLRHASTLYKIHISFYLIVHISFFMLWFSKNIYFIYFNYPILFFKSCTDYLQNVHLILFRLSNTFQNYISFYFNYRILFFIILRLFTKYTFPFILITHIFLQYTLTLYKIYTSFYLISPYFTAVSTGSLKNIHFILIGPYFTVTKTYFLFQERKIIKKIK